jgi:6-phosphogluconate dehydrogenase
VVAYATDAAAVRQLAAEGAIGTATLDELVDALRAPRVVWIMVYTRFRSRRDHTFAAKALSAMRQKFGGHLEPSAAG